jgi:hypothetical protein
MACGNRRAMSDAESSKDLPAPSRVSLDTGASNRHKRPLAPRAMPCRLHAPEVPSLARCDVRTLTTLVRVGAHRGTNPDDSETTDAGADHEVLHARFALA